MYKGKRLTTDPRVDLPKERLAIVEYKATTEHNPVFEAQTLTYLRQLGLVINFATRLVKDGVHRVVSRAYETPSR